MMSYKVTGIGNCKFFFTEAQETIGKFFEDHPETEFISAQLSGSSEKDASYRWEIELTLWFTAPVVYGEPKPAKKKFDGFCNEDCVEEHDDESECEKCLYAWKEHGGHWCPPPYVDERGRFPIKQKEEEKEEEDETKQRDIRATWTEIGNSCYGFSSFSEKPDEYSLSVLPQQGKWYLLPK